MKFPTQQEALEPARLNVLLPGEVMANLEQFQDWNGGNKGQKLLLPNLISMMLQQAMKENRKFQEWLEVEGKEFKIPSVGIVREAKPVRPRKEKGGSVTLVNGQDRESEGLQ